MLSLNFQDSPPLLWAPLYYLLLCDMFSAYVEHIHTILFLCSYTQKLNDALNLCL